MEQFIVRDIEAVKDRVERINKMNLNKKHFKKIVLIIIFLLVIVGTYLWFVVFPLCWPRLSFPTGGYNWLPFWGSYISFLGTITLGYVAYWQSTKAHELNKQSQKIQEASLVAEHTAVISVTNASFRCRGRKIILPDKVFNQVVWHQGVADVSALSGVHEIAVTVHAEVFSGFVSLVRVRRVQLTLYGNPNEKSERKTPSAPLFKNVRKGYSTVAITSKNRFEFTVSLLIDKRAVYDEIENNSQCGFSGSIEIELDVVTFTDVMSTYMCRINFSPSYYTKELMVPRSITPMTFWRKSELIDKEKIVVLGMEKQEDTDHEQT